MTSGPNKEIRCKNPNQCLATFGFASAFVLILLVMDGGCASERCIDPWRVQILSVSESPDGIVVDIQGPMETMYYLSHAEVSEGNNEVGVRLISSSVNSRNNRRSELKQLSILLKPDIRLVTLTDGKRKRTIWRRQSSSHDR